MGAEKSARAKKGAWVHCLKHGTERHGIKGMVRVPIPKTKAQRNHGGCPWCKQEQQQ